MSEQDKQTIERCKSIIFEMSVQGWNSEPLEDLLDLAERNQRKADAWNMVEHTLELRKHTHAEKRDIWASARKHAKGDEAPDA